MLQNRVISLLFLLFVFVFNPTKAQQLPCDAITPILTCDLTGQPNGTWLSPALPRAGLCCGAQSPDKCVRINLTLDPGAVAINFQIASGAVPPGALFYQIDCGPPTPVGSPLCLNGPGPYVLTFCKPGNNINTYAITSIPAPGVSPDDTIGNGCSTVMYASGLLVDNTISWSSIAPGTMGQYNSYLSCTSACDSTTVTAQPGAPPYVDYLVCGTPQAGACVSSGLWCDTIRIYFTPPIIPTITPNPAIFCASNTGGITLNGNISGGLPPYTYAWTNSGGTTVGTSVSYNATAAGNYTLTIYDQNYPTCPPTSATVSVVIDPIPIVNAGPDQNICGSAVTLAGSVTGATGGVWSGGNGTFTPSNTSLNATYTPTAAELASGTVVLSLTSTGNGSCSPVTDQMIIQISTPINVTLAGPSVVCFNSTATITATATGGIPGYNYSWSTGQTSQTITNVLAGTYSISVTGSGPATCIGTATITITQNPEIIVTTSPNNSISCSTTATIFANASGGTGTITYQWTNGATTPSTIVTTGTYGITVTDAVGCTANNSVSVQAANSTLNAIINTPPVLCFGATTTLTVFASGGFGSYTYSWNTGATTNSIVIGAGNYCCTVTDGAGCITTACVTVTQNPQLTVNVPNPGTICFGGSTNLNANASGGQAPYIYNWNTGQQTQSITAIAGNYTVTVTDAIGCNVSTTITVNQAGALIPNTSFTPPSCFGGSNGTATTNVSGGSSPYFYSWSPYGGSNATANGLLAGTYTVTITDAIGCSITAGVNVTQPNAIAATISINNNVSCNGGADGSATVNPSGGTPGYTYTWNPGGGNQQTVSNLSVGNYFITISDLNGCLQTVQTSISEPTALVAVIPTSVNVSCNGGNNGSATASAGGGTPNYSYSWSSGSSTAVANALSAGVYTVTVTDLNGCPDQATVTISEPTIITANLVVASDVSCFGGDNGSITSNISGGTTPYTFSWNTAPIQTTANANNLPAGTYSLTVTDNNGCSITTTAATVIEPTELLVTASPDALISCESTIDISVSSSGGTPGYSYSWSTGSTATTITVNTGTYSVIGTDALGCRDTAQVSVLASNSTLTSSISQPPNICNGSSTTISVTTSGGFGGNTFLWDTGETSTSIIADAGSHCVVVTDAQGCISNSCVVVNENTPVVASIGTPAIVCVNGTTSITASGSGGQAPYNYIWSNSQTNPTIAVEAGTYTITVSDATGLSCNDTAVVTVSEEPSIAIILSSTNVSCYGAANGTATAYVSGGMPGYTYVWNPNGGTSDFASGLAPGIYTLTATDAIGCSFSNTVNITQPASPVNSLIIVTDVSCYNGTDGSLASSPSGGNQPYYYYWAPMGSADSIVDSLPAGTYSLTVADQTGCFINVSNTINEPPPITMTYVMDPATCSIDNGNATVSGAGGTGSFNYNWSPIGGTGSSNDSLAPGNYIVTVIDANNCSEQFPVSVTEILSTLNPDFLSSTACLNSPTLFNDQSSASNDSIINYFWEFGDTLSGSNTASGSNPQHTYTEFGQFNTTLIVTTALGCIDSISMPVNIYPLPVINFTDTTACENVLYNFTNLSSISSGSISSWNWNFGDSISGNNTSTLEDPTHIFSAAGTMTVTLVATSNNGCVDSAEKIIIVHATPVVAFTPTSVCLDTPTQFADGSNVSGSSIVGWNWTYGDGSAVDTIQNPIHTYTGNGPYTATLEVTSANGCIGSATNNVNVLPIPIADFLAPDVCLNNPTQFTNQSIINNGTISSYTWDFGNFTPVSNSQNPNYIYAAPGVFNVMLIATSNGGCVDTIIKPVTVYALPNANFTNTNACTYDAILFTDQSTVPGGGSVTGWIWAFGDGTPVSTTQNVSHEYYSAGNYNVSLVATFGNNCRDTITKPITVSASPSAFFSISDSSGCATYCTQFVDHSFANGGTLTSWNWNFGDSSLTGTSGIENHCYENSGVYDITLIVSNSFNCVDTITLTNLITVYPVPEANFDLNPQSTTTLDTEISFFDQSSGADAWQWDFGDPLNTLNSSQNNPTHVYQDSGIYCITLTVENNYYCRDSLTKCIKIDPVFTFYIPNAFSPEDGDDINLNNEFKGYGTNIRKYKMWIYDRWGDMIFETDDIEKGWNGHANNGKNIAQEDVYIYKVILEDIFGVEHKYHGHVTLVR